MSASITIRTIGGPKPFHGDVLLGLVFALPIVALVLAFGLSTHGDQGIVAQTAIEVASDQM